MKRPRTLIKWSHHVLVATNRRLQPAFRKRYYCGMVRMRADLVVNRTKYAAAVVAAFICCTAQANIIPLGDVTLSGDFTLNHLYDFNHPAGQPFGWLGRQTVQSSSRLFARYIQAGMTYPVSRCGASTISRSSQLAASRSPHLMCSSLERIQDAC